MSQRPSSEDIWNDHRLTFVELKLRSALEWASRFPGPAIRPEPVRLERTSGLNHSRHWAFFATRRWRTKRFVSAQLETLEWRKNYWNFVDTDLDTVPKISEDKNNDITNIVNYNNNIVERELDERRAESLDSRTRKQTDSTANENRQSRCACRAKRTYRWITIAEPKGDRKPGIFFDLVLRNDASMPQNRQQR